MSAHRVFSDMANALDAEAVVPDPGDAGTFDLDPKKAYQYCEVVTAGVESRVVPNPAIGRVGSVFDIFFKTDGGNCALAATSAGPLDSDNNTALILTDPGDHATFKLIDEAGTKRWLLVSSPRTAS